MVQTLLEVEEKVGMNRKGYHIHKTEFRSAIKVCVSFRRLEIDNIYIFKRYSTKYWSRVKEKATFFLISSVLVVFQCAQNENDI